MTYPDPIGNYATEIYSCNKCGYYPIDRVVRLTPTGTQYLKGSLACPRCSNSNLQMQKAYRSDAYGNIIE